MISETKSNDFSEPLATLDSRLLYCREHQARQRKDIEVLWHSLVLKQWSGSTTSAVILIQGFANKDTERMLLGTALVDYVRLSPIPVL
jgi:anti-sigma-K factor RskA